MRFVVRGVAVIRSIILARLLDPTGFGLFGVAVMAVSFLELMTETGINVFFLQKKDIEKYLDTAWFVSVVRGVLITLLLIFTSGPISEFFNSPQARGMLLLISLTPLIRGFINPSIIKFQKELEFDREFMLRAILTMIETLLMIYFSWKLTNPVGLVWAMLLTALFEVGISYVFIKPWPKPGFVWSQFREIIGHGKWVAGFGILDYIFTQGDNVVVGRMLGAAPLGIYRLSYTLSTLPLTEISDVFYKVAFPTLSKMISEKKDTKRVIKIVVTSICILATVAGITIWWGSQYLVLLLGQKWVTAIEVIKILAFLGIVRSVSFSFNSVFLAYGKQKYVTLILLTSVVGLLTTIVPLVQRFGLVGAGYSAIIGATLSLPVAVILFGRTLNGLR